MGKARFASSKWESKTSAAKVIQRKLRSETTYSTSNWEEIRGYDFWIAIKNRGEPNSKVIKQEHAIAKLVEKPITYIGVYKTTNLQTTDLWEAWTAERFKTIKLHYYAYTDFYPIPFTAPSDIEQVLGKVYDSHKKQGFFSVVRASDLVAQTNKTSSSSNLMLEQLFLDDLLQALVEEGYLEKKNEGFVATGKGITYLKELENLRLTHGETKAISNRHNWLVAILVFLGVASNWETLVYLLEWVGVLDPAPLIRLTPP